MNRPQDTDQPQEKRISRKEFLRSALLLVGGIALGSGVAGAADSVRSRVAGPEEYDWELHSYGMLIRTDLCIGCGRCANACKTENDVPREPFYFRTWIERYVYTSNGEVQVDSPNGGIDGFPPLDLESSEISNAFFVPKLCNHCAEPPCVQVCPAGATYETKDGAVLVDRSYCIGCRYCIQACPYGARFMNPVTGTADKCTFCYHRITKGLKPACAEVCPTEARLFGDLKDRRSKLSLFLAKNPVQVLKPHLNTRPKVYYPDLDKEVS